MSMHQRTRSWARAAGVICVITFVGALGLEYWPTFSTIEWLSLEEAKARAQKEQKLVYLDVYAEWCGPCKLMERVVFTDDSVRRILQTRFVPARVNIDDPVAGEMVKREYSVRALPTSFLLRSDGFEGKRRVGFLSASELLSWLNDPTLSVFASWLEFSRAQETAREYPKTLLVLVLKDQTEIDLLQQFFGRARLKSIIEERYVPTLLISSSQKDKEIINSLGVAGLPEVVLGSVLLIRGDGTEMQRIMITRSTLFNEYEFIAALLDAEK